MLRIAPMVKQSKQVVLTKGRSMALLSALVLSVSALLPWGVAEDYVVSGINFTDSGIHGDGLVTITIGIAAFVLIFVKKIPLWISFILGIVSLIIGLNDFAAMNIAVLEFEGQIGAGLYITILASIGIVLGVLIELLEDREQDKNLYYVDK